MNKYFFFISRAFSNIYSKESKIHKNVRQQNFSKSLFRVKEFDFCSYIYLYINFIFSKSRYKVFKTPRNQYFNYISSY